MKKIAFSVLLIALLATCGFAYYQATKPAPVAVDKKDFNRVVRELMWGKEVAARQESEETAENTEAMDVATVNHLSLQARIAHCVRNAGRDPSCGPVKTNTEAAKESSP